MTFEQDPSRPTELWCITVMQDEWSKWVILQDTEETASVSMAELMTEEH